MKDSIIGLDQTVEEEMVTYEISDEALEAAAGMGSITQVTCTGLPDCPG